MSGCNADAKIERPSDDPALLLVESLIHELIANGTLTTTQVGTVVEIAIAARDEIRADRGDAAPRRPEALEAILATLRLDAR